MRRTRFLILLMCLAVMSTAWAESITEGQARNIAATFMSSRTKGAPTLRMAHKAPMLQSTAGADKAAYYVFNAGQQDGFVIIAGDDRAPSVLGYSDRGSFDAQDVPEPMQYLLEGYAAQIEALSHGFKAAQSLMSARPIQPLVPAVWSQNNPYNILLPVISGNHAPAGCVATAMAQVMYYWKWPVRPTQAIPAYTSSAQNISMPELPIINFDWDSMQDTYETRDTTSVAALAAARLTLYCAQSMEMNFNASSSSATTTRIPLALSNYYGYKASAHSINRLNYTSQGWADALYAELSAGRPVVYSGSKASGGHAFICDGYDGNGMFHINWGWNGQSNGYFLLNVLNPDQQGTGSASGAYGYIYSQAAIVGIEPGTDSAGDIMLTSAQVTLDAYTSTRTASNYNFSATVSGRFYNYTSQISAVSFGWGLYQGETMIKQLYNSYNTSLKPGSYLTTNSRALSFGADITSGTYRIVPICSAYGANNWKPCIGADMNYIEVTINGNTCTFKGYGTASTRNYTVNDITFDGTLHNGRPVNINVNMTNNGDSRNDMLHMFVNGAFTATAYVSLEKGETGNALFRYLPAEAGTYTLTFSWNDDGSNPIATRQLTITEMPAANLATTVTVLNVTDNTNKIITDNKFSVKLTIMNNGSTTYDEDISVKLFKHTYGTSGSTVQGKSQHLVLAPGATATMQFDMDNVIDGWQYFIWSYCYSSGTETKMKGSTTYTVVFPEVPQFTLGDVDGNGTVEIGDVSMLIDYLLGINDDINLDAADMDQNGEIEINDVTALIDFLLMGF